MFIGYEIKQNQGQAKPMTLTTDIKLSQAVLDPASTKGNKNKEPVCLVAEYLKKQFILAVLDPSHSWQAPLDLMFAAGTEVKFFVRGSGTVHLTGFESYDDLDDMSMSMSSDEDIEEDDEESELEPARKKIKEKTGSAKKIVPKTNGVAKPGSAKKNGKVPAVVGEKGDEDNDSDESDDEDFDEEDFDEDDDDDDDVGDEDDDEEMLDDLEDEDDEDDESDE